MTNPESAIANPLHGTSTPRRMERDHEKTARLISLISTVVLAMAVAALVIAAYQETASNYSNLTSLFIVSLICVLFTSLSSAISYATRMVILASVVQITLIISSFFISGMGIVAGLFILIFTTIIASATLEGRQSDLVLSAGIFASMAAALLNIYAPVTQVILPAVQVYLPSLLGILLMVFIVLLSTEIIAATLRIKLLTALMAIVLIPSHHSFIYLHTIYPISHPGTDQPGSPSGRNLYCFQG